MELDLSLDNGEIYSGVKIGSYGGRKSFELNQDNLNLIGENIAKHVKAMRQKTKEGTVTGADADLNSITLTGATAIPVYLVAFHAVVHNFHEVRFRNEMVEVIVAKH